MALDFELQSTFALALETSGRVGGVALGRGGRILSARTFPSMDRHAKDFLPTIDSLTREHKVRPADIGLVFVSVGPGSFTGLRIGVAAARMLALAHGARLVAVPSLEATAHNALESDPIPANVTVMIDAKRQRVYAASFQLKGEGYIASTPTREVEPARFLAGQPLGSAVLGGGVRLYCSHIEAAGHSALPEKLHNPLPTMVYRLGAARAAQGEFISPRLLVPLYVRPPEAEEKCQRSPHANAPSSA